MEPQVTGKKIEAPKISGFDVVYGSGAKSAKKLLTLMFLAGSGLFISGFLANIINYAWWGGVIAGFAVGNIMGLSVELKEAA